VNFIANISRYDRDPKILSTGRSSLTGSDRVARCLGWFSIVLGTVELLAPRTLSQFLGIKGREGLLRVYGARELGTGIMSLSTEKQAGMWSRVLGDGLDLATLMGAYRSYNAKRTNVGLAIGMVIGVAMLDIAAGKMTVGVHARWSNQYRRYSDRSGFPGNLQQARGAARADKATEILGSRAIPRRSLNQTLAANRSDAAL
jgi:hypothetical protein